MRAGSGVVLENSRVTWPSHSGSSGVTFTMMPQRAYVDLPRQMVSRLRGIRKYSTVRASANEFGGRKETPCCRATQFLRLESFGVAFIEVIVVKTVHAIAQ